MALWKRMALAVGFVVAVYGAWGIVREAVEVRKDLAFLRHARLVNEYKARQAK